jgi:hypothetical protein
MMQLLKVVLQLMQQMFTGGGIDNGSTGGGTSDGGTTGGATTGGGTTGGTTTGGTTDGGLYGGTTDDGTTGGGSQGGGTVNGGGGGGRTHNGGTKGAGGKNGGTKGAGGKNGGTKGAGGKGGAGSNLDPTTTDYTKLDEKQRSDFSHLDDKGSVSQERRDAAIIHIGGRAHISDAPTKSGVSPTARIYNDILNHPTGFKPEEVKMVQEFAAKERAETKAATGTAFVTGKYLDLAFIDQMGKRDGISQDKLNQYKQAVNDRVAKLMDPKNPKLKQIIADSQTEVTITSDIKTLQQKTGLTRAEQAAYRLAGHSVLFSEDGNVDGTILGISYQSSTALDSSALAAGSGQDVNIDPEIKALAAADQADDGKLNGSSLRLETQNVMDKIYLGQGGVKDINQINNDATKVGLQNGRSLSQIKNDIANGGAQALQDLKNMAKNHTPAMLAAAGGMAAAAAVCPFLGGMAAGGAAISAGYKALQNQ